MNKNIIVAFVIAIVIFSLFAVYGLVNQDYLKIIEKNKPKPTTTTVAKVSQECTKQDGDKTYKYVFSLKDNMIEKINISYENKNNSTEFELLKESLNQSFGGITNKHLLGNAEQYVFTFDINETSDSLNELDLIKNLNIKIYNTKSISEYVVYLDQENFMC